MPIPTNLYGPWLQLQLPSSQVITYYSFSAAYLSSVPQGIPTGFSLLGSNDGSTWYMLDTRTGGQYTAYYTFQQFNITNSTSYQYYRFVITNAYPWNSETNLYGFGVGNSGAYYPPSLASSTDQGYTTTNSPDWAQNGGGYYNWYYLTQNSPSHTNYGVWFFNSGPFNYAQNYTGSDYTVYQYFPAMSAPSPPTSLSSIHHDSSASINFTPGFDGNDTITNYSYATSTDNSTFTSYTAFSPATGAVSSVSITGLTNGVTYYIKLKAINNTGTSTASSSVAVTPSTTASAPYNLSATHGNQSAIINFTPGYNGGSPVTNYQYATSTDNVTFTSFTAFSPPTGVVSSVTVTGLTNGTVYYIKLEEVTIDGPSAPSSSIGVHPSSTPDAPTSLSWVDLYNGNIAVSFTPGYDEGAEITNYLYSLDGGANFTLFSPPIQSSPVTISGLTNRTNYSLELKAMNMNGAVSASTPLALYYMCFLEGTKILCYDPVAQKEVERSIETLRSGDLVKTTMDGYKAIDTIGTSKLYNPSNSMRSKNRLYRYAKENHPELTEDLIITGCHAVLVHELSEEERHELIDIQGKVYVTEDYYRLIACVDKRSIPYEKEGLFNIWHFALENDNYYFNYGVFANGLKVETASKRMMKEMSGMNLL